jgi:serine phosphatase RsbU (regulator of sigma subunit)
MKTDRQIVSVGDVITVIYCLPLAILGLVWLAAATDLSLVRTHFFYLLLHGILIILLDRLNFFLIIELRIDRYGSTNGSLDNVILWTVLFILGPVAIWLGILYNLIEFGIHWRESVSTASRWNRLRSLTLTVTSTSLSYLVALQVYDQWGGTIPIAGLDLQTFLPAFGAIVTAFLTTLVIWSGYIVYGIWTQIQLTGIRQIRPVGRFLVLALGLPVIAHPFSIILAGLYVEKDLPVYILLLIGLFIVAYLTRQLSWMAETSRQQSRILEKLEQLSRAIINSPPGIEAMTETLAAHVPNMFPAGNIAIWTDPNNFLCKHPVDWAPPMADIAPGLESLRETVAYLASDRMPWRNDATPHYPTLITPIFDVEQGDPFGWIYLELRPLAQPWYRRNLHNLFPAIQALAAQTASAIRQVKMYSQSLEFERMTQELEFAGQIQASFLPFKIPRFPGWQLSVTLDPVGETSGDFFDIIPLGEDRLGIVVADVADKGIGPALYMALSRTLIRTYATEFDAQPDIVFFATNERILRDTNANLFVTTFYCILDLKTGSLTYANAGHNPPFHLCLNNPADITALRRTGIPIGIEEGITWSQANAQLDPGDVLILYTDGIPDAQNDDGEFFGEQALVEIAKDNLGRTAEEIQSKILDEVYQFVGEAPQFDDITLIVLIRNQ